MDYERAYKEALDWMCSIYPTLEGATKEDAEHYFPELKESEDEKIRKEMITFFENYHDPILSSNRIKDTWLEWLEKQGEHAKFRKSIQIGDEVTRNKDGMLVNLSQLKRVAKKDEKQGEQKHQYISRPKYIGEEELLGEQNPAKKVKSNILTVERAKEISPFMRSGFEQKNDWSEEDERMCAKTIFALAGFMGNEDKIDWLYSIKDRVQPKTKYDWSEEDERKIEECAREAEDNNCIILAKHIRQLKSFRPSSQWKPSDEQIEVLESATENCAYSEYQDCLRELAKQLKKL